MISPMSKRASFYRDKANEMRDLARRRTSDVKLSAKLEEVAREYDRLAVEATG